MVSTAQVLPLSRILLVEDDSVSAGLAKAWLERDSHVVDAVYDGNDGAELALQGTYDLLILDWELPGQSGLQIITKYRTQVNTAPVLFVTGKNSIDDKTAGFNAGADDYLTKPYELRELSMRVKALLRRPPTLKAAVMELSGIKVNSDAHKVYFQGKEVQTKPREFALLELLINNPNNVYSSDALKDKLWQFDADIGDTGIRVLISRLRHKLGADQSPIKTVYGVGYTFSTET